MEPTFFVSKKKKSPDWSSRPNDDNDDDDDDDDDEVMKFIVFKIKYIQMYKKCTGCTVHSPMLNDYNCVLRVSNKNNLFENFYNAVHYGVQTGSPAIIQTNSYNDPKFYKNHRNSD